MKYLFVTLCVLLYLLTLPSRASNTLVPLYNSQSFQKKDQEKLIRVLQALGVDFKTNSEGNIEVDPQQRHEIQQLVMKAFHLSKNESNAARRWRWTRLI